MLGSALLTGEWTSVAINGPKAHVNTHHGEYRFFISLQNQEKTLDKVVLQPVSSSLRLMRLTAESAVRFARRARPRLGVACQGRERFWLVSVQSDLFHSTSGDFGSQWFLSALEAGLVRGKKGENGQTKPMCDVESIS